MNEQIKLKENDGDQSQQSSEIFEYSSAIADDQQVKTKPQTQSNALTDQDEDLAIADYSQAIVSKIDDSKKEQQTKKEKKDEDIDNQSLSMAEKILKSKSNQESDQNKVEDSDLIEEDDDSKKKEHNITMQEKQNIEFWAKQDPEAKQNEKKLLEEKKKKEEQENLLNQQMKNMSDTEIQKVQHLAIQQARMQVQTQQKEQIDEDDEKSTDLIDFDETENVMEDWENTRQYAKYMEKTVKNADEKFEEKKEKKPIKKKSKDELQKEAEKKALEDDIEQVQKLYQSENEKEEKIYQKNQELHIKELKPQKKEVKQQNEKDIIIPENLDGFSANKDDEEPSESIVDQKQQILEQPKSFFEAIWENNHPEEVQKAKEAAKRKAIEDQAKLLKQKADELNKQSKLLTLNLNKTQNQQKLNKTMQTEKQKLEKKKEIKKIETVDEKVERLLSEGKSLGEIQINLQMEKPYYIQQKIIENERVEQEANKEIAEFMKDPFKDPMQELIDSYANIAEERKQNQTVKKLNQTIKLHIHQKNSSILQKQKEYNKNQQGGQKQIKSNPPQKDQQTQPLGIGPKKETEEVIPGKQLEVSSNSSPNQIVKSKPQMIDFEGQQISEEDLNKVYDQIIQNKKEEKFEKMIEKGALIAEKEKKEVLDNLIGKSLSTDRENDGDEQKKITKAILLQTQSPQDKAENIINNKKEDSQIDEQLNEQMSELNSIASTQNLDQMTDEQLQTLQSQLIQNDSNLSQEQLAQDGNLENASVQQLMMLMKQQK